MCLRRSCFTRTKFQSITFVYFYCTSVINFFQQEILQYSADYSGMATEEALKDLTQKMAHYKAQYESPSLGSHWELPCPMIKVLDSGEGGVVAHGVVGTRESKILGYISTAKPIQQTLYFSRVSIYLISKFVSKRERSESCKLFLCLCFFIAWRE